MTRLVYLRACVAVALLLASVQRSMAEISNGDVLLVSNSRVEAYTQAVTGIKQGFERLHRSISYVDLNRPDGQAALLDGLRRSAPALIITVGAESFHAVGLTKVGTPVLATMILRSDAEGPGAPENPSRVAASVYLDLPLVRVLAQLKRMYPSASKAAIIRRPGREVEGGAEAQLKKEGFVVRVVECGAAQDLLPAVASLKGQVDFILCPPDGTLFNSVTAKPFILSSLEARTPIVAFSSSFVRAGAALGFFPNYSDVGLQTAEIADQWIKTKHPAPAAAPRLLCGAVNERVLRLLGMRLPKISLEDRIEVMP